ncbi:MAG: TlpA family protein disulfide reductase [Bacteroidota bacterium]
MFKKYSLFLAFLITIVGWGCSAESDHKQAHISGSFTVADSSDENTDYSDIGFTIIQEDTAGEITDTLFHAVTDSNGSFSGTATFQEKQQYPMTISRNDNDIGRGGIILAEGDSVFITGQLPDVANTLNISSREHEAMEKFQQLGTNFRQVMEFARAGQITGDSLRNELQKWSNLYWDVYEEEEGTFASYLSARESIKILEDLDQPEMMNRIRVVDNHDDLSDLGATRGKRYLAQNEGLTSALTYLDSLANVTESEAPSKRIAMEKVKLLYDSARVDAAQRELDQFKKQFSEDTSSNEWVESMSYDLNYLSPGETIPDFQFAHNGSSISRDSMIGQPYILEITRLSNNLYQDQFDRTVVIHSIYKNYGLQVVTIPLDENQVTVDAFFEERVKPWPVADAETFDRDTLLEQFNIRLIPTRFLIDKDGKIVRKYVGNEYDDVIQGIQQILNNKEEEPPS